MSGLTPEQIIFRRRGISGSDAPAICGVSNYRTEADVWLSKRFPEKVSPLSKAVRDRLEWGQHYEALIAQKYVEETGIEMYKPDPKTFVSAEVPWILGSPDFLANGAKIGLECKKVSEWMKHGWGPAGTDLVPPEVLLQCAHYMMLTQYPRWDVSALIGESDMRIYTLHANRDLLTMLVTREQRFYEKYIAGNEEPVFETAEAIEQYLKQKYPTGNKARIIEVSQADVELIASIKELRAARELEKKAKSGKVEATNGVKTHMGDAGELHWKDEALKITWKNIKDGVQVDWEKIAKEALEKSSLAPEERAGLIAENTSPKPGYRRFAVFDKSGADDE